MGEFFPPPPNRFELKVIIMLIVLSILISTGLFWGVRDKPVSNDKQIIDSLQTELMDLKIINGRNEYILEKVGELDSTILSKASSNVE